MADLLQCRQDMKQHIKNQPEAMTTAVYREKLLHVSVDITPLLPSKEVVSRSLHELVKLRPPLPATAEVFELTPYQTVTGTNEHFCCWT